MLRPVTQIVFVVLFTILALVFIPMMVNATPITFSGEGINPAEPEASQALNASAEFEISGNDLTVTLTNTSSSDITVQSSILTAIFFDLEGNPTLTPVSAFVNAGSNVVFFPTNPINVGGEWDYKPELDPLSTPGGARQGISSAGLSYDGFELFNGNLAGHFPPYNTNNLQGPEAVDGVQFGIISPSDDPTTGQSAVTGANAFVDNSVVFTLSGLPGSFTEADISNVSFQYGTSLSEPTIPEPGFLLLLSTGMLAIAGYTKLIKRKRKSCLSFFQVISSKAPRIK